MNLVPWLTPKFTDADGNPLAGGLIYTYEAGTTTPLATYTDASGLTPNTNPIVLDANGAASIWLGADAYKFEIADADDVVLQTIDGVQIVSPDSITTAKIADGAVTTPKIADLAITNAKLNNLAVSTAKIQNLAVTTAKLNDSAVTTEKINDEAVTPSKLSDLIYSEVFTERSKIINGDMDFWQRGTIFVSPADKAFLADRWQYHKSGAMAYTIQSEASILPSFGTPNNADLVFNRSMKISCTTADATIGATDLLQIGQSIEGYFFRDLIFKEFVCSFWVYSSKTGKFCVAFKNGLTGSVSPPTRSYVSEFTITTANTWQKVVVPVPAPTNGTWTATNGVGLEASIVLSAGSTYQTTAGAWQNGNYSGTSTMDNFSDVNTNVMYVTGFRLEGGSIPRQYESRHPSIEQTLCNRYFEIINGYFLGYNPNVSVATAFGGQVPYSTPKPVIPAVVSTIVTTNTRCDTVVAAAGLSGVQFRANLISGSAGQSLLDATAWVESEFTI